MDFDGFDASWFPELGGCADCREADCACMACSLRDFLEDSSPYDQEFCSADDQGGRNAGGFMAPADNAGTAEGVNGGPDRYRTAPMMPVDGTNRCELTLDDLEGAFFGSDAESVLPGARRQAPAPPPSPEVRKKPLPENTTPESNKRSRPVFSTPVPANNGESGRRLVELAMEAASACNTVAEAAYLFRASGQSDGKSKDGNVYKYARYIGEICAHGCSRSCLLSHNVDDKNKVAAVIRNVSTSHASVTSSGTKISYNYNRAVDLYRVLSSSFATDAAEAAGEAERDAAVS